MYFKILLAKGANINATDNDGWTAFMRASSDGFIYAADVRI